jgi:protein-L-isoaspartate O-methyltransferase
MIAGERQIAPDVSGIRRDHVARYEWAARQINSGQAVLDCGCGVGYGSKILARNADSVIALDNDAGAIAYAKKNYSAPALAYLQHDAADGIPWECEAAIAFEIIEHLADPRPFLKGINRSCGILLASVPNEKVFPFRGYKFHHRHYTAEQFEALLNECGWRVDEWWGQLGPESEVERNVHGRTLVVRASRLNAAVIEHPPLAAAIEEVPRHVAIIGLGYSAEKYMDRVKRLGSRRKFADQIWGINCIGDVLRCDLVFHMDDIRIQEIRARAKPDSNIAAMVEWLRGYDGRVITSFAHPDYPCLETFPLQDVINELGLAYFNNTVAYAVVYALFIGVEKISIFGCDYTYPDRHKAEKGRACLEFWLGYAKNRGVELAMPPNTTLMDCRDDDGEEATLYGYDAVKMFIRQFNDGEFKVTMEPLDKLPTAEEIEDAYDHGKHPLQQGRKRE